jgi:hypothetical protein
METALLAQESVFDGSSIGLPQNQWQLEVRRWFETSLAKMQASFVEFVANDVDGSYITVNSIKDNTSDPLDKALLQQCHSQRIQATSFVQNFSLLGILVVICIRVFLIVLSLVLESCISFLRKVVNTETGQMRQLAGEADNNIKSPSDGSGEFWPGLLDEGC